MMLLDARLRCAIVQRQFVLLFNFCLLLAVIGAGGQSPGIANISEYETTALHSGWSATHAQCTEQPRRYIFLLMFMTWILAATCLLETGSLLGTSACTQGIGCLIGLGGPENISLNPPEIAIATQEFRAMEKDTSLPVATSACATMSSLSKEHMAMEGQRATCPSMGLLPTELT